MNNLQNNFATNNQPTATFNFPSLADVSPEFFNQLQNLDNAAVSEKVLEDLCFEIAGKCDQWAITALMMLFNSLSSLKDAQTRAENFQTVCFRWTAEADEAERGLIDALRGNQQTADQVATVATCQTDEESEPTAPTQSFAVKLQLTADICALLDHPELSDKSELDLWDCVSDDNHAEVNGFTNIYGMLFGELAKDLSKSRLSIPTPNGKTIAELVENIFDSTELDSELKDRFIRSIARTFTDVEILDFADIRRFPPSLVEVINKRHPEENEPLDLSEMSPESLGTDDSLHEAAECFSKILNNDSLPELVRDKLKLLIVDDLFNDSAQTLEFVEQIQVSSDYIEAVLKGFGQNQN